MKENTNLKLILKEWRTSIEQWNDGRKGKGKGKEKKEKSSPPSIKQSERYFRKELRNGRNEGLQQQQTKERENIEAETEVTRKKRLWAGNGSPVHKVYEKSTKGALSSPESTSKEWNLGTNDLREVKSWTNSEMISSISVTEKKRSRTKEKQTTRDDPGRSWKRQRKKLPFVGLGPHLTMYHSHFQVGRLLQIIRKWSSPSIVLLFSTGHLHRLI